MTMEILYRNASPAYKGSPKQPTQRTGPLAGFGAMLGGGATPAYRAVAGARAPVPAPARSWWQSFAVTPSYKTAVSCAAVPIAPGEPSPDGGDGDEDAADGCPEQAMQVVIL